MDTHWRFHVKSLLRGSSAESSPEIDHGADLFEDRLQLFFSRIVRNVPN